jgi:hypothetical protein
MVPLARNANLTSNIRMSADSRMDSADTTSPYTISIKCTYEDFEKTILPTERFCPSTATATIATVTAGADAGADVGSRELSGGSSGSGGAESTRRLDAVWRRAVFAMEQAYLSYSSLHAAPAPASVPAPRGGSGGQAEGGGRARFPARALFEAGRVALRCARCRALLGVARINHSIDDLLNKKCGCEEYNSSGLTGTDEKVLRIAHDI